MLLKNAYIPLAKFTYNGIKVDVVFADMATPKVFYSEYTRNASMNEAFLRDDYLLSEQNVLAGNFKSAECLNGFLQTEKLRSILITMAPDGYSDKIMRIFSEVTVFIKCWATKRGIYNFNLGYLNGISIMILVARALQTYLSPNAKEETLITDLRQNEFTKVRQQVIEHFFTLFAEWPWESDHLDDRAVIIAYSRVHTDYDINTRE